MCNLNLLIKYIIYTNIMYMYYNIGNKIYLKILVSFKYYENSHFINYKKYWYLKYLHMLTYMAICAWDFIFASFFQSNHFLTPNQRLKQVIANECIIKTRKWVTESLIVFIMPLYFHTPEQLRKHLNCKPIKWPNCTWKPLTWGALLHLCSCDQSENV